MRLIDIPSRIVSAWATSAQAMKRTIAIPSQSAQTRGRASFTDGFPSECATLNSGVSPSIYDMNGILNTITALQQYQSGGGHFQFDSVWSSANNGYPKGALLVNAAGDGFWFNVTDNNTNDPSVTTTGWLALYPNNSRLAVSEFKFTNTSQLSYLFTGIPSWAKRITVSFDSLSTSGGALPLLQLGTSAGIVTTGYKNSAFYINSAQTPTGILVTSGIAVSNNNASVDARNGQVVFTLLAGNNWAASGMCGVSHSPSIGVTAGGITMPGTVDRLLLTTTNGADVFDGGGVSLMYEG